jgi:pimeloyl-ACP methyl ester carboxylesterase/class 3 adenylate cyclase
VSAAWQDLPHTRYFERDGAHLAYQLLGQPGPGPDILMVPGWFSHVEEAWSLPRWGAFVTALSELGRVILYDNRGMGLSDRGGPLPAAAERAEDALALLDHVGSERFSAVGISEGGTQSLRMASLAPERVDRVVVLGSWARLATAPDWPIGIPVERVRAFLDRCRDEWGTGSDLTVFAPSVADDPAVRDVWARYERRAASPGDLRRYAESLVHLDIRHLLPEVRCPVLVIHNEGDRVVPVEQGRYLGEALPDVRYVELPSTDHLYILDGREAAIHEIQRFLSGSSAEAPLSTELGTLLFVDVVSSTTALTRSGDAAWSQTISTLTDRLRATVHTHRGRTVTSTGDGLLATFSDPEAALATATGMHGHAAELGLVARVGVHTGRYELRGRDVSGFAVHLAARICDVARPGTTVVSRTTRDLVRGSAHRFTDLGAHDLRGIDDPWHLHRLDPPSASRPS